jgi:hypothetical protein
MHGRIVYLTREKAVRAISLFGKSTDENILHFFSVSKSRYVYDKTNYVIPFLHFSTSNLEILLPINIQRRK